MGKSAPRERHLFPSDNNAIHEHSRHCACKPHERVMVKPRRTLVYVHNAMESEDGNPMKTPPAADTRREPTFTVVIPTALRSRFERWLRHEHLRMVPDVAGRQEDHVWLVYPDPQG